MTELSHAHGAKGALIRHADRGGKVAQDRALSAGWWILPAVLGGILLWALALGSLWAWLS